MRNIAIDTSTVATSTIVYGATDQAGNTATSTRTVITQPMPMVRYPLHNHDHIDPRHQQRVIHDHNRIFDDPIAR